MSAPRPRLPRFTAGRRLSFLLAGLSALAASSCSLWVGAELSSKPDGAPTSAGPEGGGGQGGSGQGGSGNGGTVQSTTTTTSTASGSTSTGTSTGAQCPPGHADCDGDPQNGCETDLAHDSNSCGSCDHACPDGKDCNKGKCK